MDHDQRLHATAERLRLRHRPVGVDGHGRLVDPPGSTEFAYVVEIDGLPDDPAIEGAVRWSLHDQDGTPFDDARWQLGSDVVARPQHSGLTDVQAPLTTPLTILLPMRFREDKTEVDPPAQTLVTLQASVALREEAWTPLSGLHIPLPDVPLPTIAVLFEHKNFNRIGERKRALVLVPESSRLGLVQDVAAAIEAVRDRLAPLHAPAAPTNVTLLLAALDHVARLSVYSDTDGYNAELVAQDELPRMDILLDEWWQQGAWWRLHADDNISSLLLIGPPGRQLQCFNAAEFAAQQGRLDVTVGSELCVAVADLQRAQPASVPDGRVCVWQPPGGTRLRARSPSQPAHRGHRIETFGDEISSVRFAWTDLCPTVAVSSSTVRREGASR